MNTTNKFIQTSELNFSPEPKTCRQTQSSLDQSDRLWKYSECRRMGSMRHQKLWLYLQLPSWSQENQLWLRWGTIDPCEEQEHRCLTLVEKWGTAPLFATPKGKLFLPNITGVIELLCPLLPGHGVRGTIQAIVVNVSEPLALTLKNNSIASQQAISSKGFLQLCRVCAVYEEFWGSMHPI